MRWWPQLDPSTPHMLAHASKPIQESVLDPYRTPAYRTRTFQSLAGLPWIWISNDIIIHVSISDTGYVMDR